MSLSQGGDKPTLRTAVIDDALNTGGLTEDGFRLQADRDARIVGVQGGKNDNQGFLELSFSSQAVIGGVDGFDDDADTLWILAGNGDSTVFGDLDGMGQYYEWDEDQELHVHEVNNTGTNIEYAVTIYYVEEHEC